MRKYVTVADTHNTGEILRLDDNKGTKKMKRVYQKPTLTKRQALSTVTAAPAGSEVLEPNGSIIL